MQQIKTYRSTCHCRDEGLAALLLSGKHGLNPSETKPFQQIKLVLSDHLCPARKPLWSKCFGGLFKWQKAGKAAQNELMNREMM